MLHVLILHSGKLQSQTYKYYYPLYVLIIHSGKQLSLDGAVTPLLLRGEE